MMRRLVALVAVCAAACSSGGGGGPTAPVLAQEPARNPSFGVDPNDSPRSVLLHSGEYRLQRTDLAIRGRRTPFSFTRVYRGLSPRTGPLGPRWDANVFMRVEELADGTVRCHPGNGRTDDYAPDGLGGFTPPPGVYTLLRREGGGFLLRDRHGWKVSFDAQGRITRREDRVGNRMDFAYDGNGRLDRVTDEFGREVAFAYDAQGRLVRITDFTGREVVFAYDAAGRLAEARSPVVVGTPTGNDFPQGKTERYAYDAQGRLAQVVSPNEVADGSGTATLVLEHDGFGRVVRYTVGGTNAGGIPAGGTLLYAYGDRQTRVTDRNGNVTDYFFDAAGHMTRVVEEPDGDAFETTRTYNAHGEVTAETQPLGNRIERTYDEANPDRFQQGNLLSEARIPDAARGGEQARLTTTFTYEPLFNRVATVTDPRGNEPAYVPQNGGAQSPGRYTSMFRYDWQEGAAAPAEAADFGIDVAGAFGFGDLNGDGRTDQAGGMLVRRDRPTVTLAAGSKQAAAEGDAAQEIVDRWTYNDFGQPTAHEDARGNTDTLVYFPENDPDGDQQDLIAGRDAQTGGYLRRTTRDATAGPRRQDASPPAQITNDLELDRRGNVTARTDGRGLVHRTVYNALDQVVETEAPLVDPAQDHGYLVRVHYDANDNMVAREVEDVTTDPVTHLPTEGGTFFMHTFAYDILDNVVRSDRDATRDAAVPDCPLPERLVTELRYDANENTVRVIKPEGNEVAYGYDARDLLVSLTRGAGSADASTWTFAHDRNRNGTGWTDAEDADTRTVSYDGFDRPVATTDRAGNEERWTYDPASNLVARECRGPVDGSGGPNVVLCRDHHLFDELDRRFRHDRELFLPQGAVVNSGAALAEGTLTPGDGRVSEQHEYDALSRTTFFLRDDGACYEFVHDGADRLVSTILPLVDPNGPVPTTIDLAYDGNDNVVRRVETHANPEGLEPPAVLEHHFVFDALDRPVRATDPKGQTTYAEYDSRDNTVSSYDARGAAIPDPLGLFAGGDINDFGNPTRHRYDGVDRLWTTVRELHVGGNGQNPLDLSNPENPDGLITTHVKWDGNGRVVERIDDVGNATTYAYDALDRRTRRTHADGGVRTWVFDRDDRVTRVTDENDTVHDFTYDALDRLLSHALAPDPAKTIPNTALPFLVGTTLQTFEWDGRSRLTRSTDNNEPGDAADDRAVEKIYDSLDRPVEERQQGRAVGSSWTADDRTDLHYPGAGRVVHHAYDPHNQLVEVSNTTALSVVKRYLGSCCHPIREIFALPGAGTAAERRTALDANKLPQTIDFVDGVGAPTGSVMIGRNRADDVADAAYGFLPLEAGGGINRAQTYALDSQRRLATLDESEFSFVAGLFRNVRVAFDGAGGIRSTTEDGDTVGRPLNEVFENTAYTYNASPGTGLRTQDDAFVYQWDGLDRLRAVRRAGDPDTVVATYTYDADPAIRGGRRTDKAVSDSGALDGTTQFLYDGDRVIEERDGADTVLRQFVYGAGADDILALDRDTDADGDPDELLFHQKDFNGNVVQVVGTDGAPVEFYTYGYLAPPTIRDAATQTEQPFSQVDNPYLFTGRRWEPETGLYYYRARYYDPADGEFLSRDPLGVWGDPGGDGNPMAYAGNNPWNRTDPSGLIVAAPPGMGPAPPPFLPPPPAPNPVQILIVGIEKDLLDEDPELAELIKMETEAREAEAGRNVRVVVMPITGGKPRDPAPDPPPIWVEPPPDLGGNTVDPPDNEFGRWMVHPIGPPPPVPPPAAPPPPPNCGGAVPGGGNSVRILIVPDGKGGVRIIVPGPKVQPAPPAAPPAPGGKRGAMFQGGKPWATGGAIRPMTVSTGLYSLFGYPGSATAPFPMPGK